MMLLSKMMLPSNGSRHLMLLKRIVIRLIERKMLRHQCSMNVWFSECKIHVLLKYALMMEEVWRKMMLPSIKVWHLVLLKRTVRDMVNRKKVRRHQWSMKVWFSEYKIWTTYCIRFSLSVDISGLLNFNF